MIKKRFFRIAAIGFAVAVLVVIILALYLGKPEIEEGEPDGALGGVRYAADSHHSMSVRAEIAEKGLTFLDHAGVRTWLGPAYREKSPLVEILSMMRDPNGRIHPFAVEDLVISAVDGGGLGSCSVRGKGLRLQIDSRELRGGNLLYDKKYRVVAGYKPDDASQLVFAMDSAAVFKTPAHLDPGQLYRVKLILLDKQVRREMEQETSRVAEERERVAGEESIRISARYPNDTNDGTWTAAYLDQRNAHEGYDRPGSGTITIRGPNRLGGELLVFFTPADGRSRRTWCYLENVRKRTVRLPEDADFVVVEDRLVSVYFALTNREAAVDGGFKTLALYLSPHAKLPLFTVQLQFSKTLTATSAPHAIPAMLPPGVFHIRAARGFGDEIPLGRVQIGAEVGKIYDLQFDEPLSGWEG